jgi:hypothetical protein
MPIHDWSHVPAGLFHHFHQRWSGAICDGLNDGRLPEGYYALVEQHAIGVVPDVLTLHHESDAGERERRPRRGGGLTVADAPPAARFVSRAGEEAIYAARANRVAVRTSAGRVTAVIEIVSPGNKNSRHAIRSFVYKSLDLLAAGVQLLVIDLFPPSPPDPDGIHPLLWSEVRDEPFALPPDKPLTVASYLSGPQPTAYVNTAAVGDPLPEVAVFLDADTYVLAPLEPTYADTWERCPREFKDAVLSAAGK